IVIWRLDPFRVRRRTAATVGSACLVAIIYLAGTTPEEPWEAFRGVNHVSYFARSGVASISELMTQGVLESDPAAAGPMAAGELSPSPGETCRPNTRPPHIILVLDESSFDITVAPGIKVPEGYERHFRSFDGKTRSFLAEASGGPT